MLPDQETIRAYSDGELWPTHRAEVEAAIASDPEVAREAQAMFASRLPYQSAFACRHMPPVPERLQSRIADLARVADASVLRLYTSGMTPVGGVKRVVGRFEEIPARMSIWMAALVLLGGLLGYCGAELSASLRSPGVEPWVANVAIYHALYSRETVSDMLVATKTVPSVQQEIAQKYGLQVRIPELSGNGLQFVRAQQLEFAGNLVLQLVYLPGEGRPIALCLMPANQQPERALTVQGQQVVTWHDNGWAYVLVGNRSLKELEAIRKSVPSVVL